MTSNRDEVSMEVENLRDLEAFWLSQEDSRFNLVENKMIQAY